MPVFRYTAIDASGRRVSGEISVASEQAAVGELEARRLVPVAVRAHSPDFSAHWKRRSVPASRLAETYTQLGDLLRAGVPLLRALKLLGARRSQPVLAACFRDLSEAVSQGRELAAAMGDHAEVFPSVHIAMVRAGERGGFLEALLARLGAFVASQAELRSKVIGSLIYPSLLVGVGLLLIGVVLVYFVPQLRPLVAQVPDLPLVSRAIFWLSDFARGWGIWVAMGVVMTSVVVVRSIARERVMRTWQRVRGRLPVVGRVSREVAAARLCRLLGTLLGNGIPMLTAMEIARGAAGDFALERAISNAAEAVRAGRGLAGPLGDAGVLSDDVVEMIAVGESANNLDEVLLTIAEMLERRVDRSLASALRLVEPLLLLVIAVVVGLVAAGLLVPIMRMRAGG